MGEVGVLEGFLKKKRLQYIFFFVRGSADSCAKWCRTDSQPRGAGRPRSGHASTGRGRAGALKLTVLLEDMELRVLRLLASVTTIAEGKRDGWEY